MNLDILSIVKKVVDICLIWAVFYYVLLLAFFLDLQFNYIIFLCILKVLLLVFTIFLTFIYSTYHLCKNCNNNYCQ